MRRRPPPRGKRKYYSPSYYGEIADPLHLSPGWARWLMGLIMLFGILFMPFVVIAIAFGVLRFIWLVIQAVVGL